MSAAIRLSSKLPGDPEINGLDHLAGDLEDPELIVCALVWVKASKITTTLETGERVPTVEVRRIEPIGPVDQVPAEIVKLAARLYEDRTGRDPLPFDEVIVPKHSEPYAVSARLLRARQGDHAPGDRR